MRVAGGFGGTHGQRGRAVHRAGHDAGAREHFTRHRLTVDVAQVERGGSGQQLAIYRHGFTGQHNQHIAGGDGFHRNGVIVGSRSVGRPAGGGRRQSGDLAEAVAPVVGAAVAAVAGVDTSDAHAGPSQDVRCLGRGRHQRGQAAFGLGLGVFLDGFAGRDHQHHGPARPVFLHGDRGGDRHDSQQIHTDPAMPQIVDHAAHGVDDRVRHHDDDNPLAHAGIAQYRNIRRSPRAP